MPIKYIYKIVISDKGLRIIEQNPYKCYETKALKACNMYFTNKTKARKFLKEVQELANRINPKLIKKGKR